MGNKIKYGLKNAFYSVITVTDNVPSYAAPVAWPGAVSLVLNPQGEKTEFYADDIAYFETTANDGYEGNLETALVPDSFKKDVLGFKEDSNGVLFEDANAIPKNFALLYQFAGDQKATRRVMYNCNPTRPNEEGKTKEKKIDPQTETIPISAKPAVDTGYVKAKAEQGQAPYDTWFTAVYLEDAATNSVTPATVAFSKAAPADVALDLTSSSGTNSVVNVKSNGVLIPGVKLSITGIDVTIDDSFFSALANGSYTITVELAQGASVSCVVTVGA